MSSHQRDLYGRWGIRRLMGCCLVITTNNYHLYPVRLLYYNIHGCMTIKFSRTDMIVLKFSYSLPMHCHHLDSGNLTEILDSVLIPNFLPGLSNHLPVINTHFSGLAILSMYRTNSKRICLLWMIMQWSWIVWLVQNSSLKYLHRPAYVNLVRPFLTRRIIKSIFFKEYC